MTVFAEIPRLWKLISVKRFLTHFEFSIVYFLCLQQIAISCCSKAFPRIEYPLEKSAWYRICPRKKWHNPLPPGIIHSFLEFLFLIEELLVSGFITKVPELHETKILESLYYQNWWNQYHTFWVESLTKIRKIAKPKILWRRGTR